MLDRKTAPTIHNFGAMEVPKLETITLSNNIKLNILRDPTIDVIRFDVLCRGGKYEASKALLPQITLSLLRKGTINHSGEDIANILDFNGSWFGGNASDHHIRLTLSSLCRNFKESLSIFYETLTEASFPKNELAILKQQLIEETKISLQRTRVLASNRFNEIMYGSSHPFGIAITPELIEAINIEDVVSFHDTFIKPSNMELFVVGNVTDDSIDLIKETFECQDTDNNPFVLQYKQNKILNSTMLDIVNKPNAVQSSIIMGINAPGRAHPDYIPLRILVYQLGGYFGSRLNSTLREEKGYTYGIGAGLMGHRDFSYIQISTDCATQFSQQVIDGIRGELKTLCEEPINEDEMKILRSHITSDVVKMIDSTFSIVDYHMLSRTLDFPERYFENQLSTIETISANELQAIAQKYFNTKKNITVLAGDKLQLKNLA